MVESDMRYGSAQFDPGYPDWFTQHRATQQALDVQRVSSGSFATRFAVVVDAHAATLCDIGQVLASVAAQTYRRHAVMLCGAASAGAAVSNDLDVLRCATFAEGLRAGADVADYVCVLDAGCRLEPDALFEVARACEKGDFDLAYSDNDMVRDGVFAQPYFKGDFSADLLRDHNYVGGFFVVAARALAGVEACPEGLEAAWAYDIALKVSERARRIVHLPRILFHDASQARGPQGYDCVVAREEAEVRAVSGQIDRLGLEASVQLAGEGGRRRIVYRAVGPEPSVTVIIPTKDQAEMLAACVDSILEKTTYGNYRILLVENNSTDDATFAYYERIERERGDKVSVLRYEGGFNFSKIVNYGAAHSQSDYILLLNNDMEVIEPEWMSAMVGICQRGDVGAVGARLLYRDGRIQHAGVVVGGSGARHLSWFYPSGNWGYHSLADSTHSVSAVTGACLLTRRTVFNEVGGFREEYAVAFNDIDYCLKVRERGLSVVYYPYAELYHFESVSRGYEDSPDKRKRLFHESALLQARWPRYYVEGDPFHNVNLDKSESGISYYRLTR